MELPFNKLYDYNQLADMIIENLILEKKKVLGVTGTSCVGKSTFSKLLKSKLEENGLHVFIIRADNYLREEFRGGNKFWTHVDEHLKPGHFDWSTLWKDVLCMQKGQIVHKKCYMRGVGWKKYIELQPADVIIIEGLFLDSKEAAQEMRYNLVTVLQASDELIRKRRMERDDFYRENFKNFKRTKEETLKEIEETLQAEKSYIRCKDKWNLLKMRIEKDFYARIETCNIVEAGVKVD